MTPAELDAILAKHARVAIVGAPRTGKTTLAATCTDREVIHTDDHKQAAWANQPAIIIGRTAGRERFVIEGVQTARALRKGLEVDAEIVLTEPKVEVTPGQKAMGKGHDKILREALRTAPGVTVYREGDQ